MVGRTSLAVEMLESTLPLGIRQLNGCGTPSHRRLRARVDGRLTAIWVEEKRIALSSLGLSCASCPSQDGGVPWLWVWWPAAMGAALAID